MSEKTNDSENKNINDEFDIEKKNRKTKRTQNKKVKKKNIKNKKREQRTENNLKLNKK